MRFEGDIDWNELKKMFRQISELPDINEHRGTRISAHMLAGFDLKKMSVSNDVKKLYRWMKQLEGKKTKISNLYIGLRKFPKYNDCAWSLNMSSDESFYEVSCNLVEEPKRCMYSHNSCGKLCKVLYRGFVEGKFDYEDIIAGARRPKSKGH